MDRLFGADLFTKLGLGGGSTLLAGISILLIPVLWVSPFLLTWHFVVPFLTL